MREHGKCRLRMWLRRHLSENAKEFAAVRTLRGHVTDAELRAAEHAYEYMLAHEGPNGPVPDYL